MVKRQSTQNGLKDLLRGLAVSGILGLSINLGCGGASANRVLKNPYADVNWDRVQHYKANFHTHTTNSDGRGLPGVVINAYAEAGYHVLALTDHDNYHTTREGEPETVPTAEATWPWTTFIDEKPSRIWKTEDGMETSAFYSDLGEQGMLAIRGNELTTDPHIVSLFSNCGWLDRGGQSDDERLGCVDQHGGLAYYAHPYLYVPGGAWWEGRTLLGFESPADWDAATAYYGGYITGHDGCLGFEMQLHNPHLEIKLFNKLLERYYRDYDIFVMGSDDNHNPFVPEHAAMTLVLAETLTEEALRAAMRRGHTLAGLNTDILPRINRIEVDAVQQRIVLDIDHYDEIVWFRDGEVCHRGDSVSFAELSDAILRFEIRVPGSTFYSQAFLID